MEGSEKKEKMPRLDELFVIAVQAALETGHMLKLSHDQFIALVESAWQVHNEHIVLEQKVVKEKGK